MSIKGRNRGRMRNVSLPPRPTWRRYRVRPGRPQAYRGRSNFFSLNLKVIDTADLRTMSPCKFNVNKK